MESESPPPPTNVADWARSPLYRSIHSNVFRYKGGAGDISLTFANIIEGYSGKAPNVIEDQISVTMNWQQAKIVATTLNMMISVIEELTGEIEISPIQVTAFPVERSNFTQQMRTLYPQKQQE